MPGHHLGYKFSIKPTLPNTLSTPFSFLEKVDQILTLDKHLITNQYFSYI